MIRIISVILIALFSALQGRAAVPIEVFTGIPPVAYLVERIGSERVHVNVLLQSGQDPHTYEPAPKQIQALGRAKLFFKVGMPFENRLIEKLRDMQIRLVVVDTTDGIEKRRVSETHSAQHEHEHSAADFDPHVWLSPLLLKKQAANITAALEKADPVHAKLFQENQTKLLKELDALDAKIRQDLKPYAGRTFYVFHPAFGYFADCFNLKQEAIEAEGKQPSPKQLRSLIQKAKKEKARIIFVQPQFDQHSAQAVADAINGRIMLINDLEKDVPVNLHDMALKIKKAWAGENK